MKLIREIPRMEYQGCVRIAEARLRIYRGQVPPYLVLVLTELLDNRGASIWAAAPAAWSAAASIAYVRTGFAPAAMTLIEHLPQNGDPIDTIERDAFSNVTFADYDFVRGFTEPAWSPLPHADLERILGQAFPVNEGSVKR